MRFLKLLVIVSLVVGVFLVGLSGNRNTVLAQDVSNQTYLVQAGYGTGNIAYFNFAPSSLKVHQGDTVRWIIAGGHNVHFEAIYTPLLLPSQQDGKSVLNVNPAVLFGNVQSGDSYTGGEANNGLSIGGPPQPYFELKINAPVGTYQYYCDIHPAWLVSSRWLTPRRLSHLCWTQPHRGLPKSLKRSMGHSLPRPLPRHLPLTVMRARPSSLGHEAVRPLLAASSQCSRYSNGTKCDLDSSG